MRVILSGPDGSGKTSIVNCLKAHFEHVGPVHIDWRRFGFVFARGFNLIARRLGWSYYEQTPAGSIGYHDYKAPWSHLFLFLAWIDCVVFIIPKWWLRDLLRPGCTIIVDRFLFDIVADLILSTRRPRAALYLFNAILERHCARNNCVFLFCAPIMVYERRPDVAWDRSYIKKVHIYTLLRRLYAVPCVRTDQISPEESTERVIKLCGS